MRLYLTITDIQQAKAGDTIKAVLLQYHLIVVYTNVIFVLFHQFKLYKRCMHVLCMRVVWTRHNLRCCLIK